MQMTPVWSFVFHHKRRRAHSWKGEAHRLVQVVDVHEKVPIII